MPDRPQRARGVSRPAGGRARRGPDRSAGRLADRRSSGRLADRRSSGRLADRRSSGRLADRRSSGRVADRWAGQAAVIALAAVLIVCPAPSTGQLAALPAPVTGPLPTGAAARPLPRGVPGLPSLPRDAAQVVTVTSASSGATTALVRRWQLRDGAWEPVGGGWRAQVGAAGITGHPSENRAATPAGTFALTLAFGAPADTDGSVTRLPYLQLRPGSSWGTDPGKPATYNRYFDCHCADGSMFRLRTGYFRYGVVIDYNRPHPVPGAGSGFFVHVGDGRPTAGCVALPAADVRALLRWLRPAAHPRIVIRARS